MMQLFEIEPEQVLELAPVLNEVFQFASVSSPLIVAMWDDEPTCFVGFIPIVEGVYMWMETLPLTDKHKLATARHAKDLIAKALQRWPKVVGHCKTERSVRWLKSLGAEFVTDTSPFQFEICR